MAKLITIITGPIVGLYSTKYIEQTVEFAAKFGYKIFAFNLFDEIMEQSGIKLGSAYEETSFIGELLDGYQYQFQSLREKAYLSISRKIDKLPKNSFVIIRTPASIEWRGVNNNLKDHRIIAEVIRPDRIVTLIDAEWKISERLKTSYGKHVLQVIAHQKELTLEKILQWLGMEVSVSEDWAEWAKHLTGKPVRHYVLGIHTPSFHDRTKYTFDLDNLTKFATQEKLPAFYSSYSMTVATESVRKQINGLIWQLRGYGVVIDPASIEIGTNIDPKDESVVFAYTVCRDLEWDVKKVDIVSAFHPYTKMPPLSTGMLDELGHARAFRKERYFLLPSGGGSPFTKNNYVPEEHIFKTGKDFFNYLEHKRKPELKPFCQSITKAFAQWQLKNTSKL
jgi:hypothetical protein